MKLDAIIYDQNTLANALAEQWATESDVFASMYPSDTATALVNGFAAYGSMLQYCLVAAMANCYTSTAFSETGIYQLAETLGNNLHGNEPALVTVAITKTNFLTMKTTIPANSQFKIKDKKFFNPNAIIIPANTPSVTDITLIQGEWTEVNKFSSGIINEKIYFASNFSASHNYIKVLVNGVEWKVTDSFLDYDKYYVLDVNEMNVVVLKTDPDGNSYIRLGDGQLGTLPPAGSTITIQYVVNDGQNGNIQETNIDGELVSDIILIDNEGNQASLAVNVVSTSTAYGGFNKQSIATLRHTSPYIFASGHRAVRRQDYNAILQNECGYLTSSVWGEWEEADYVGTYDSLMMNMVYYTGLKSFEYYNFFSIGKLLNSTSFSGTLYTTKGFWGSYSLKVKNITDPNSYFLISDTGANGTLYINDNVLDPRDSLLPEWIATESDSGVIISVDGSEIEGGNGYKVNDILNLVYIYNENTELESDPSFTPEPEKFITDLYVKVLEVSTNGSVSKVEILTTYSADETGILLSLNNENFDTTGNTEGSGCKVKLIIEPIFNNLLEKKALVTTNDLTGIYETATQDHPIENARSDQPATSYYKSLRKPTLTAPVQIRLNYGDFEKIQEKGIAAIKFKPTNEGVFIGTLAMFGWKDPVNSPNYENVRNSEEWDCIINRTYLTNPSLDEDHWTDWISTNTFTGENDAEGKPKFTKYKYYVIEFYSTETVSDIDSDGVAFEKLKILYDTDASVIYYNNNGLVNINFPIQGSPGPSISSTSDGYLTENLLNNENRTIGSNTIVFPLYSYDITVDGANASNGYNNGNTLAYNYISGNGKSILFIVTIINAANGLYSVTLNGKNTLIGEEDINLAEPISLDTLPTYTLAQNKIKIENGGNNYRLNDLVEVLGVDSLTPIQLRVARVDGQGKVKSLTCASDLIIGGTYDPEEILDTKFITVINENARNPGEGLKVKIEPAINSSGTGATISIISTSNVDISASFIGNRLDTADINKFDQSIIEKYNHFTTYVEFKQPEIVQKDIVAQVAIKNSSTISSGMVIQEIKNNIQKLFDITPDYIGKGLALSDIYKAISKTENVEWCKVLSPIDNIIIRKNQLLTCKDITIQEVINTIN